MSETPDTRPDATRSTPDGGRRSPTELTTDELYHTLQCERRRLALRHLLGCEGPTDVDSLVTAVATAERDTTVDELSDDQHQRIRLDLYQSHLPKLDDLGLVAYDQSRNVVEPTPAIDALEPYLGEGAPDVDDEGSAEDAARNWTEYYAGTSFASLTLLGVAALGSPVALSFRLVAALVTTAFTILTAGIILSKGL